MNKDKPKDDGGKMDFQEVDMNRTKRKRNTTSKTCNSDSSRNTTVRRCSNHHQKRSKYANTENSRILEEKIKINTEEIIRIHLNSEEYYHYTLEEEKTATDKADAGCVK